MAEAQRVEDALQRLNLQDSTAVIQVLGANGPMRFVHISEEAGLDNTWARHRLLRLQADGLVTRTGSRHGDPYILTSAGEALGAVYATVEHWSEPITGRRASPTPRPVAAATRTHAGVPLGRTVPGRRRPCGAVLPRRPRCSAMRRNRGCRRP